MAADAEMVSADAHKDASTADATASEPAASVQADIQHNLTLLRSAVSILEPRLTTKVLRTLGSIRKRLDAAALKDAIEAAFPTSESPACEHSFRRLMNPSVYRRQAAWCAPRIHQRGCKGQYGGRQQARCGGKEHLVSYRPDLESRCHSQWYAARNANAQQSRAYPARGRYLSHLVGHCILARCKPDR